MRTSNHANIILWVYVRFTFNWNVDCCWCMDCILMIWREHVRRLPTRCVSSTKKKFIVVLGLKSRVVTRPVDPIKIGCTGSPTLRPRTCGQHVVSQSLGGPNQYRAPNLKSSWPWSNTRLSSPKNTTTYRRGVHNSRRIMNSFAKWSWTWHHRVVIHVRLFFGCITTSLLLQLHHYVNL